MSFPLGLERKAWEFIPGKHPDFIEMKIKKGNRLIQTG
jgi:hypothetical protein